MDSAEYIYSGGAPPPPSASRSAPAPYAYLDDGSAFSLLPLQLEDALSQSSAMLIDPDLHAIHASHHQHQHPHQHQHHQQHHQQQRHWSNPQVMRFLNDPLKTAIFNPPGPGLSMPQLEGGFSRRSSKNNGTNSNNMMPPVTALPPAAASGGHGSPLSSCHEPSSASSSSILSPGPESDFYFEPSMPSMPSTPPDYHNHHHHHPHHVHHHPHPHSHQRAVATFPPLCPPGAGLEQWVAPQSQLYHHQFTGMEATLMADGAAGCVDPVDLNPMMAADSTGRFDLFEDENSGLTYEPLERGFSLQSLSSHYEPEALTLEPGRRASSPEDMCPEMEEHIRIPGSEIYPDPTGHHVGDADADDDGDRTMVASETDEDDLVDAVVVATGDVSDADYQPGKRLSSSSYPKRGLPLSGNNKMATAGGRRNNSSSSSNAGSSISSRDNNSSNKHNNGKAGNNGHNKVVKRAGVKQDGQRAKRPRAAGTGRPSATTTAGAGSGSVRASFLSCAECGETNFRDEASLEGHIKKQHTRPFTCVLHFAGCTSTFASKNEWKRHVSSQHLMLTYWLCTQGLCGEQPLPAAARGTGAPPTPQEQQQQQQQQPQRRRAGRPPTVAPAAATSGMGPDKGTVFNRKDLFTQHIRRMHTPPDIKKAEREHKARVQRSQQLAKDGATSSSSSSSSSSAAAGPVEPPAALAEWDEHVRGLQGGAHRERCRLPDHMACPAAACEEEFVGPDAWDQRMEHVARHLERASGGDEPPLRFGGHEDETLVAWAARADVAVIVRGRTGRWVLNNPLRFPVPRKKRDGADGEVDDAEPDDAEADDAAADDDAAVDEIVVRNGEHNA